MHYRLMTHALPPDAACRLVVAEFQAENARRDQERKEEAARTIALLERTLVRHGLLCLPHCLRKQLAGVTFVQVNLPLPPSPLRNRYAMMPPTETWLFHVNYSQSHSHSPPYCPPRAQAVALSLGDAASTLTSDVRGALVAAPAMGPCQESNPRTVPASGHAASTSRAVLTGHLPPNVTTVGQTAGLHAQLAKANELLELRRQEW